MLHDRMRVGWLIGACACGAVVSCTLTADLDSLAGSASASGGTGGGGSSVTGGAGSGWPDASQDAQDATAGSGGTVTSGGGGGGGNGSGGTGACTPTTCAGANAECGTMDDGCGTMLSCGMCSAPAICGDGAKKNRCVGVEGTWQLTASACAGQSVLDPTVTTTYTLAVTGELTHLATDSDCTSMTKGVFEVGSGNVVTLTFHARSCSPEGCKIGTSNDPSTTCQATTYAPPVVYTGQYAYQGWQTLKLVVLSGGTCSNQELTLQRL